MGLAVGDLEALAQPLQSDGVLELEQKPGQSRGIQVVVAKWMAQGPRHEPGVEAVGRVLNQDRAIGELLEGGGHLT
jgi:hypothetical protein